MEGDTWTCSCPSFSTSRFLICKHLIHLVRSVPTIFFKEACRARSTPFWKHPKLIPHLPDDTTGTNEPSRDADKDESGDEADYSCDDDDASDVEEEGDEEMAAALGDGLAGSTFEEEMAGKIDTLIQFAEGLRFQVQFRDQRLLKALEREGGGLWRVMTDCLEKERRAQSTRGSNPGTWDNKTNTAMWFRARPRPSDDI